MGLRSTTRQILHRLAEEVAALRSEIAALRAELEAHEKQIAAHTGHPSGAP